MTNPVPAPTREGAIDTCPSWCVLDHPDTGNYDKHVSEQIEVPAYTGDLWSHDGGPNANLFVYAQTYGVGMGVTVEIGAMKAGGAWSPCGSEITSADATVIAAALNLFATYTDEPAKV